MQKLLDMSAAKPPPDSVQNLEDPPNDNKLALVVIATCIVLSTLFSILRVYSRVYCAGQVKIEDCEYRGEIKSAVGGQGWSSADIEKIWEF